MDYGREQITFEIKEHIDLLAYATLVKRAGGDWKKENLMSLAGVYSGAAFLHGRQEIRRKSSDACPRS